MEAFSFTATSSSPFKGLLEESSRPADIAPQAVSVRDTAELSAAPEVPSAELVRRFNDDGDESAFLEMMRRYQVRIFNVAFRILNNRADAEEITQDTFIRAHRGLAAFRGDSSLITWLHHIAMNLARNRYWYHFRRKRQATLSLDYAFGENAESTFSDLLASEAPGPCREAATNEFVSLIDACMKKLDPVHLTALMMRYTRNSSYEEIGRVLGVKVGTVKSRISRARADLRQHLGAACPEFAESAPPSAWFERVLSAGQLTRA